MDKIDFRSDTVSWPTPEMREAMANARVGDDVYGEDPSTNELQTRAATMMGKEAGLFVASGTMGNLVAALTHAGRGDMAIVGRDSHSVSSEAGSISALGGVVTHPLPTDVTGRMRPADVAGSVPPDDPHLPPARLVLLENSYGARNGYPLAPEYFEEMGSVAREHGLSVHLDGARLFNAAVALGVEPAAITSHVDSVTFCLSKGLCAPVGSVLCGSADFIHRARRVRKMLGGAMRQAGVLAAAGLVALTHMIERLADDHDNARTLAQGLSRIPGIVVDEPDVKTNIIYFRVEEDAPHTAEEVRRRLREEHNIWISGYGSCSMRAVTHYWVGPDEVALLLDALRRVLTTETAARAT